MRVFCVSLGGHPWGRFWLPVVVVVGLLMQWCLPVSWEVRGLWCVHRMPCLRFRGNRVEIWLRRLDLCLFYGKWGRGVIGSVAG